MEIITTIKIITNIKINKLHFKNNKYLEMLKQNIFKLLRVKVKKSKKNFVSLHINNNT